MNICAFAIGPPSVLKCMQKAVALDIVGMIAFALSLLCLASASGECQVRDYFVANCKQRSFSQRLCSVLVAVPCVTTDSARPSAEGTVTRE